MDAAAPDVSSTTPVSITVLSVTPMRVGKLFALAAVEIDIADVLLEIHGIRVLQVPAGRDQDRTSDLPGCGAGRWQTAIILPEEVRRPIGDVVLDRLV